MLYESTDHKTFRTVTCPITNQIHELGSYYTCGLTLQISTDDSHKTATANAWQT